MYDLTLLDDCISEKCSDFEVKRLYDEAKTIKIPCIDGNYFVKDEEFTTIVTEFDLVCQSSKEIWQVLSISLMNVGSLGGSFVQSWMVDAYGRKNFLGFMTTGMFASLLATAFSPNEWVYSLLRMVYGFFSNGVYLAGMVYVFELTSAANRIYRVYISY